MVRLRSGVTARLDGARRTMMVRSVSALYPMVVEKHDYHMESVNV